MLYDYYDRQRGFAQFYLTIKDIFAKGCAGYTSVVGVRKAHESAVSRDGFY